MKKIFNKLTGCSFILAAALLISSCANYSVFNGGAAGLIVDAESTTTPKAGIANVDVYAFTSIADRNINYNAWLEGTIFKPSTTAVSSIILFVVSFEPPEISFFESLYINTVPHPPGPGLPEHAPSVYITTFSIFHPSFASIIHNIAKTLIY